MENNKTEVRTYQMSESWIIGLCLALGGGFLDAYSYVLRGGTFATMQTGNMILLMYNIIDGNIQKGLMYLIPITAFFIGILITSVIEKLLKNKNIIHWRQICLLIEVLCLVGSGLIPLGELNYLASSLISFAAAIQLETFKKVQGLSFASTMCTGNLKSAAENFANFITTFNKSSLLKMALYFAVILCFIAGVALGTITSKTFTNYGIMFSIIIYFIVFVMMFIKTKQNNVEESL